MDTQSIDDLEILVQQAEVILRHGDIAGAFARYCQLLREIIASMGQESAVTMLRAAHLVIIERVADLAALMGNTKAADSLLAGMVAINAQVGNHYAADYTNLKRIHLTLIDGKLGDAYRLLQGMAPTLGDIHNIRFKPSDLLQWEKERHWLRTNTSDRAVLFSRIYLVMGRLLASLGQYSDAIAALKQGLLYTSADFPDLAQQARVPLHLALVSAELEKGELNLAASSLHELEDNLDEVRHPAHMTNWLELSGKLNLLHGDLGQALHQFQKVSKICQDRGFHHAELRAMLNLVHISIYLNQTHFAQSYLRKLQNDVQVAHNAELQARISALLELSYARSHSPVGNISLAPTVSQMRKSGERPVQNTLPNHPTSTGYELLRIPQSDNYLTFFEERSLAFHWLLGEHHVADAATYFVQIQQVFKKTDSTLIQMRLRIMEGLLLYYQNKIQESTSIHQSVRETLRSLDLKPELWQVQRVLGWCWMKQGIPSEQKNQLTHDTEQLLEVMTSSLPTTDQALFLLNKWTADEEYLAGQINQLIEAKRDISESSWLLKPLKQWRMMKYLNHLIQHIDHYKDSLARRTIQGQSFDEEQPMTMPLWHRLLFHPRDQVTLSFLVLPNQVLIITMGWFSLDFSISSITRIQVRDLVRDWHELHSKHPNISRAFHYGDDNSPIEQDITRQNYQITSRLIEGLRLNEVLQGLPSSIRSIIVIPDDVLHGFPFASIFYQDQYLIERFAISTAFTHKDKNQVSSKTYCTNSLLVGLEKGIGHLTPLPGVGRELHFVTSWLEKHQIKSTILINELAQRSIVENELSHASFIHIACHGIFESNQPDASGLILLDGKSPSVLSLRTLSELNLAKVVHITLSSCWGADHLILPGRWVISLPEVLWRAGAQSILGSLWEVNDQVAVAFMKQFYFYLDTYPRAEALRRTQLDCLRNELPDCTTQDITDPIQWSGFVLYGEHRRLHWKSKANLEL